MAAGSIEPSSIKPMKTLKTLKTKEEGKASGVSIAEVKANQWYFKQNRYLDDSILGLVANGITVNPSKVRQIREVIEKGAKDLRIKYATLQEAQQQVNKLLNALSNSIDVDIAMPDAS